MKYASNGRFSFESGILQNMICDTERIANTYGKEFIDLYEMSFVFYDIGPVNSETGVNESRACLNLVKNHLLKHALYFEYISKALQRGY